jgi:hypothetical protein
VTGACSHLLPDLFDRLVEWLAGRSEAKVGFHDPDEADHPGWPVRLADAPGSIPGSVDQRWYAGQINADELDSLRRLRDQPIWIVWQHTPPIDPDSFVVAAVTGDGPKSESHARMFADFLNRAATTHGDNADE